MTTIVGTAPTAQADEGNTALALQKFDQGREAIEAGDFTTALAAFEASHRLLASPNSLLYMARCHKGLGRLASAYTTFRLAYRQAQDRLVTTSDKRYAATRDSATREAAEIEPDVPKLAIVVPAGVPSDFVVKANGNALPRESWGAAVDTDPGHIVIEAAGGRLVPFSQEIDLDRAETKRVDVTLTKKPTATLKLRLATRPLGLGLRIDGAAIDPSTVDAARDLDPGPHVVEVSAPGHRPFAWNRTLRDAESALVDVDLAPNPTETKAKRLTTPRWIFFAAGGAAVTSLGVASVLAIDANSRSQTEQDKSSLQRSPDERDGIRTEATIANVLFISGAVFAIGTGVLAFTTDWKGHDAPAQPAARIVVRPIGMGLGAAGSF